MADCKIRFAVIGTGNVAAKYADAFKNIETGVLSGAVGTSEEKAKAFAEKNGIASWAGNLETLLNKTDIDAVIVAVPSGLHSKTAIQAAKYGKHVLCEKPLDITLEKIDDMAEACRKAGVKLGCAYQHRTSKHNTLAYEVITSGKLGRIYIANAFLKNFRDQKYYESGSGWRGTWALDGGGPFMQQAAHTVDLMVWMMGRAKSVFAATRTVAHDIEVEDMGHAIVEYENGAQGVLEASTVVKPGYPNKIEFHGQNGSIILDENSIIEWNVEGVAKPDLGCTASKSGAADPMAIGTWGHEMIIRDFIEAINKNRIPLVPQDSARLSVELILAIYKSAKTGKRIQLR